MQYPYISSNIGLSGPNGDTGGEDAFLRLHASPDVSHDLLAPDLSPELQQVKTRFLDERATA